MEFRSYLSIAVGVFLSLFALEMETMGGDPDLQPENAMVLIPAGEFLFGSTEKDGRVGTAIGVDELPQRKTFLPAFYMDKYEVTNQQYLGFVKATGHPVPVDPHHSVYSWEGGAPPAGQEDIPVTYVSWHDADAYCRWAGKRLPEESEWEKAARGTDGRQWPWGNEYRDDACNTKYSVAEKILPGGSLPGDRSPYAVYDMCGNVGEWTASWYKPYPGSTLKRGSFGETYKIARGGSWVIPALPYSRLAYRSNTYSPDYKHRGLGFRCAKDRE